jgi:tetratricopeptide (TPR) repeat protein
MRWTGREARILRETALRMTIRDFASHTNLSTYAIRDFEAKGVQANLRTSTQKILDDTLAAAPEDAKQRFAIALGEADLHASGNGRAGETTGTDAPGTQLTVPDEASAPERLTETSHDHHEPAATTDVFQQVEQLRRGLHDAVSAESISRVGLDEWEQTVRTHGQATRFHPARQVLAELASDFIELQRLLERRHSASTLRRLARATAHMAGLMFLTLIKLNEPLAARNWARTARIAADEAGDNAVRSWVRAQEAYVYFYAGDYADAVTVARHAQALAGRTNCVGVPLAAALEARALAVLGRSSEVAPAMERAQVSLATLDKESLIPSAFGYNEAQLHFHQGNAYTHLGDTKRARAAHEAALSLVPRSDFLDRTLVHLDMAACHARDGDVQQALTIASNALQHLSAEQRQGLVALRGREILRSLPQQQRELPAVRDFRDLLVEDYRESHPC